MVRLGGMIRTLGGQCARCTAEDERGPEIRDVVLDSRRAGPGALFAAVPGERVDGAAFAARAVAAGAVAVLAGRELELPGEVPVWVHPEPRRTAGHAASLAHGLPSRAMFVAAVTGTNGKTSVVHLAGQLLEAGGLRPALLGTVGHRLGSGERVEATHTTPESTEIHRLLARHREAGGNAALLEASSHGLEQERLAGVEIDVAVFTNLGRDHLDYHADLEAYRDAKRRLFAGLTPGAVAVINADDPAGETMAKAARAAGARVLRFGTGRRTDLRVTSAIAAPEGSILAVRCVGEGRLRFRIPLVGRHAVENVMAAAAIAREAGVAPETITAALEEARSAPGRLERVDDERGGVAVYVDYAHTEQALERVLRALGDLIAARPADERGRLVCVFGCGGDRDRGKRAPMGAVVNRLADVAVVTSDNPRGEEPEAIIRDILAGMQANGGADVLVEVDRAAAIRTALEEARPGDVVLIAGKGHEAFQLVGDERRPFDDRALAREVLA